MVRKNLIAILFVTAATVTAWPAAAQAQPRRGVVRQVVFARGYYYDPFFYDQWFGPWGPWYPAPYGYGYPRFAGPEADVRLLVKPNKAEVYVDGYYAGIVDDFDGVFQRLRVLPGQHEIMLRLEGYRAVHQKLYLTRDSTYKLRYTMEPLGAGETTEAPPVPPVSAGAPAAPMSPRRVPPGYPPQPYPQPPYPQQPPPYPQQPPPGGPGEMGRSASATLAIRVQPSGADVTIDGERWQGPEGEERLLVQVAEGPHRVEIQKSGYRRFTTEVQARRGETVPLNVSLSPERQ